MAKTKKQEDFNPNAYEGFRATTRDAHGKVEIYMSMTGNQGTVEDILVAYYPNNVVGRGKADLAFLFVQMVSMILNAGMPSDELAAIWESIEVLSEKYRVALPAGWTCLTIAGLEMADHQVLYV